ncbi:hypothetical protein [Arenicella xantha]|uniref:Uncharacterized protein n=1 Tax=Arenicella xantha TaxID=644221 RepID=A0A395JH70_9GAMM|nr:hypothetical protein [Arenicella xantha]RBP49185.1 hypothetical protein DFR28_104113 [Arenicella xantha]
MSDSAKRFAVYSVGASLPGFTATDVARHIAHNTSRTPASIQARLLSGRAQRVKSFPTLEKAEVVCQRLRSIGLDAVIRELLVESELSEHASFIIPNTDSPLILSDSSSPPSSDSLPMHRDEVQSSAPKKSSRKGLYLTVGIVALAAIGVFGAMYWWFNPPLSRLASEAERAMFDNGEPGLVIAANLDQIRKLANFADADAVPITTYMSSNNTLLGTLAGSKQLFESSNHLTVRISADQSRSAADAASKSKVMAIVSGEFIESDVISVLEKFYSVEKAGDKTYQLSRTKELFEGNICPIDPSLSSTAETRVIRFSGEHLLIADDVSALASLNSSLDSPGSASAAAYSSWEAYRGTALIAAQMSNFAALRDDLASRMLLGALGDPKSVEQIGVRVDSAPLSRGIAVSLDVISPNNSMLDESVQTIQQSIAEKRTQYSQSHPSAVALLSRFEVEADTGMHLRLTLDSGLLAEANSLFSELGSMVFGGGALTMGSPSEESLMEAVWDFSQNQQFVEENPFQLGSFDKYLPATKQGGQAVFVGGVGLKPINSFASDAWAEDLALQLELVAKRMGPVLPAGQTFEGDVSDSGMEYSLQLKDVLNKQGQSILRDEHCLRGAAFGGRNHELAESHQYQAGVFEVRKSVRLTSGTQIADIGQIQGQLSFRVPTEVQSTVLSMRGERMFEYEGTAFRLSDIEGGSVQYSIDGDESKIVALRALNADGNVLRSQGKMTFGDSTAQSFAGAVDSLQVFYSVKTDEQLQDFDFDFQSPVKVSTENVAYSQSAAPSTVVFTPSDLVSLEKRLDINAITAKDQASIEDQFKWAKLSISGQGELGVGMASTSSSLIYFSHDAKATWNKQLSGKVIVPHVQSVAANSDSVFLDLTVDGVELTNNPVSFSKFTVNGQVRPSLGLQAGDYDLGSFQVELPDGIERLKSIKGVLRYEIPTAVSQRPIIFSQGQAPASVLKLLGYEYGWNTKMRFQLAHKVPGLAAAYLELSDGRIVSANILEISHDVLEFSEIGEPRKMTIMSIESTKTIAESFELAPNYSY